jgi:hypothetical protein
MKEDFMNLVEDMKKNPKTYLLMAGCISALFFLMWVFESIFYEISL